MASLPGNFPRQSLWKVSKQTFALKKAICCSIILCTYCLFYYKHYVIRNAWLFKIKLEQWFLTSSLIWGNFIWKWSNQNDNFGLFCLLKKIPLAPMGVLAPWSTHTRPSTQPPNDTIEIFLAHMSAKSASNTSPNPSEVINKFSKLWDNFWKSPPLSDQM